MANGHKLLIIDDSDVILEILEQFLINKGYNITTAPNGFDGIRLFNKDFNYFDLVITDIVMPDISGIGVISILKDKRPNIPIIAITGFGPNTESLAAEANADIILEKPLDLNILNELIIELINKVKS